MTSKVEQEQLSHLMMKPKVPYMSTLAATATLGPAAMLTRYLADKAEHENPPAGQFIEVDGVQLHYLERGAGTPVVLLHGNGAMAQEFEISSLLGLLAKKYRVIAFDRPGYGYSERPRNKTWDATAQAVLLGKAMKQLGIERPIIVAHSWGTMVAMSLALEFPDYVHSLVLLSGYYYPTPRMDVLMLSTPAVPVLGDVMRHTVSPYIGRMIWPVLIRKFFSPSGVTQRWNDEFPVWMSLRPSQILASASETATMVAEALRLGQRYKELRLPVTLIACEDDIHVLAKFHSERLHKEMPSSRLVLVSGVGHMLHHIMPERVLDAVNSASNDAPDVRLKQIARSASAALA